MGYEYSNQESIKFPLVHRMKITEINDNEVIGVILNANKRLHIFDVPEGTFEIGEKYNLTMYKNNIEIRRIS
jgi:hypothetical protein